MRQESKAVVRVHKHTKVQYVTKCEHTTYLRTGLMQPTVMSNICKVIPRVCVCITRD